MIRCFKTCALAMLLCCGAAAGQAQAQAPYTGMGYFLGYPYDQFRLQNIPYYALYPPVYYSQPVARTYGYSPFAYPPGFVTPEVAAPAAPEVMVNPHVPQAKPAKSVAVRPLRIVNPHVQQAVAVVEPAAIEAAEVVADEPQAAEAVAAIPAGLCDDLE